MSTREILAELRSKLSFITIRESVDYLRQLGAYQWDTLMVYTGKGYKRLTPRDLPWGFNQSCPAATLKKVYFHGGPPGTQTHRGDYLTFLVDRTMAVRQSKGAAYVEALIVCYQQPRQGDHQTNAGSA